jgi:5-methylcytosine-specific restriction enzyme subunit McrC
MTRTPEPIIKLEYEHIGIGRALEGDPTYCYLTEEQAAFVTSADFRTKLGAGNSLEWFVRSQKGDIPTVRTGCWVGIVALKGVQIEVRPKIENSPAGAESAEVDLCQMLNVCFDLDVPTESAADVDISSSILEVIAHAFGKKVLKAAQRGLPRRYIDAQDDLPTVRGRIDLRRQTVLAAKASPLIACTFNSLNPDNSINRLLKGGLKAALTLSRGPRARKALRLALSYFDEVSDLEPSTETIHNLLFQRNELHLKSSSNLAKFFLRRKSFDLRMGENNEEGFALMFRMWHVYEQYAVAALNQSFQGTDFHAIGHEKNPGDWYLAEANFKELRPDVVVRSKTTGEIVYLADTKWKSVPYPEEQASGSGAVGQTIADVAPADAYQALAYSVTITAVHRPALSQPIPVAILYPRLHNLADNALKPPKGTDPFEGLRSNLTQAMRFTALRSKAPKDAPQNGYAGTLSILHLPCPPSFRSPIHQPSAS